MIKREEALKYHSEGRPGKLAIVPTKPFATQRDLSLAYSPGVADACLAIAETPDDVFKYTTKGNLVAVVSNGTAVLGLGNIGPEAGKPVMEGKAILFKKFADIDVFDIELASEDPEDIIRTVKMLEPTFGGINLEDIKAPECFLIEETLQQQMDIPVFHDDQHGTAIISSAALLNALEITGKKIENIQIVVNGAGASAVACTTLYLALGVKPEHVVMCDSKGVIHAGRKEGMNPYKARFATDRKITTLQEAMVGADVFLGLSAANCLPPELLLTMNEHPIVFALANPDPEITWELATETRPDVIMATGRSDYPNQVNNVLGFPYIFRGALDVRARAINMEMKIAAVKALAALAKEDVPDSVRRAYGGQQLEFGPEYIIPTPFDPRILVWEASAVAEAAMETGVARHQVDIDAYREELFYRMGHSRTVVRNLLMKARRDPKRIVYPEGEQIKILRAAEIILDEKIAKPILLGREKVIRETAKRENLNLDGVEIIDPEQTPLLEQYQQALYTLRQRNGVTFKLACELLRDPNYFGAMMVHLGEADGLVSGLTKHYPNTIRPALQIIALQDNVTCAAGLYMMVLESKVIFFADTTVNIDPTAEEMAEIAIGAAEEARRFDITPRVAMLSFSNFGSVQHPQALKVKQATKLIKQKAPDLEVDGEMQADTAVVYDIIKEEFPFSDLQGPANVLIFPDLQSGNIAYKLLSRLGGAEAICPILMGIKKPVQVLQRGAEIKEIINMSAIAVVDAQKESP
jgi:malate dehydrogenase (oxaloacetate-decarboxylating)(NADP+)